MKRSILFVLLLGTCLSTQAQSSSLQRPDPIKRGSISQNAPELVQTRAAAIFGHPDFRKTTEEDTLAGRLKLRYEYILDGEEFVYERTINTPGKTKKEIQKLIEETERELGIPTI
ncbi:hypothetical protein GCM10027275_39150 [Rhabdobacter roseus]|uniref:Uncharacterized protein n=1 Tax=Rhabdobacter roseus TaxID=1655419 RepID=A0A840U0F3_9BACT|nr:hypothetical protein [Rhabdobacter roseus]MBB5285620.1 hypothetical protein [Rhabdobacter roseus]